MIKTTSANISSSPNFISTKSICNQNKLDEENIQDAKKGEAANCFWCGKPSTVVCPKCNNASFCDEDHLMSFHLYEDKTKNKILAHANTSSNSKLITPSNNINNNKNDGSSSQQPNQHINNNKEINQKHTLMGNHCHESSSSTSSTLTSISETMMCLPYKILHTKEKGRVVVATRDIKPLELIMSDDPFIIGPSRQQQIVCIECLAPVDGKVRCIDCNFPLCRPDCAIKSSTQWHKSLECSYLKSINYRATTSLTDKIKIDTSTLLTDIPYILVELASIAPLRLLLKGVAGEKCTREMFENKPLYDFCSPKQNTVRICAFESDMLSVIWDSMKIKELVTDIDHVQTAIGQLFNNAKSLEKQGNNGSGKYTKIELYFRTNVHHGPNMYELIIH